MQPRPCPRAELLALMLLTFSTTAVACRCTPDSPPSGTFDSRAIKERARRVEIVHHQLRLATPVEDAAFVIRRMGDGSLGPSDVGMAVALRVAPEHIPAWIALYQAEFAKPVSGAPQSAPDLRAHFKLMKESGWPEPRGTPAVFSSFQGFRAVFPQDGIVLISHATQ